MSLPGVRKEGVKGKGRDRNEVGSTDLSFAFAKFEQAFSGASELRAVMEATGGGQWPRAECDILPAGERFLVKGRGP